MNFVRIIVFIFTTARFCKVVFRSSIQIIVKIWFKIGEIVKKFTHINCIIHSSAQEAMTLSTLNLLLRIGGLNP